MEEEEFFNRLTDNVKRERKKRKVSQLKLSNILGHNSTSYVARIELRQDGNNYNLSHLIKIAKEFDMEVADFIPKIKE